MLRSGKVLDGAVIGHVHASLVEEGLVACDSSRHDRREGIESGLQTIPIRSANGGLAAVPSAPAMLLLCRQNRSILFTYQCPTGNPGSLFSPFSLWLLWLATGPPSVTDVL